MENFRLKVFRTVAEKMNFRQAAEALYLTQPAITLQIKALESELGASLFDRSGNHIALTAAGKALLPFACEMASIAATAQQELARMKGQELGELRVGASTTVAQYLLPRLVGEFKSLFPAIHLSVIGANTARIVASLVDGSIALGLVEGPTMRRDLRTEQFLADHIAVISAGHSEWVGRTISPAQFAKARLILREVGSGTRRVVESALRQAGIRITAANLAMELDSTEAIKSAVEAGLGIGFVPSRAIEKELKLGTVAELNVDGLSIERHFAILSLRGAEPDGSAGAFLRFLRSVRDAANAAR